MGFIGEQSRSVSGEQAQDDAQQIFLELMDLTNEIRNLTIRLLPDDLRSQVIKLAVEVSKLQRSGELTNLQTQDTTTLEANS